MKATAALLKQPETELILEEVELDELRPDEVLVRMKGVGVCHTDIAAQEGVIPVPYPSVLGHEGSGVVEAVGAEVDGLAVGDPVALSFDHCGDCPQCADGHPAYCEVFGAKNYFGSRMDGTTTLKQGDGAVHGNWFGQSSFATYAIASRQNAVKVPDDVPLELLGPLGCGLQTGAGSVLNVLRPRAGEGIAIFGLGGVGLAALMAAEAVGCAPIVAVDINGARLEIAKELGATHTYNPTEHNDLVWDVMLDVAPGVHHSFDAVGAAPVIRQALEVLRSPGHCVTVGFQGLQHEITIDQGHLLLGRTLSGVVEGDANPHEFIPRMLDLHKAGKFPFDRLIKTFPFEEINEAIAASNSGEVIKPVLVFP